MGVSAIPMLTVFNLFAEAVLRKALGGFLTQLLQQHISLVLILFQSVMVDLSTLEYTGAVLHLL